MRFFAIPRSMPLVVALAALLPVQAMALPLKKPAPQANPETLDETSIRNIYAKAAANIKNGREEIKFLEDRLDDNYELASVTTLFAYNNAPKATSHILNKGQVIAEQTSAYKINRINNYQYNITGITFSADKKAAYVSGTTVTYGLTAIPGKISFHYIDAEGCTDMLSLVNDKIKIMKSSCNGRVTITK